MLCQAAVLYYQDIIKAPEKDFFQAVGDKDPGYSVQGQDR